MPNDDNTPKEQEKASDEALREPGDTEQEDDESSIEINSNSRVPINYDLNEIGVVFQDLEIEAKEGYQLKQSLGIQ